VRSCEPVVRTLLTVRRCIAAGGSTEEAQRAIGAEVSAKLLAFLRTGAVAGCVNLPQPQAQQTETKRAVKRAAGEEDPAEQLLAAKPVVVSPAAPLYTQVPAIKVRGCVLPRKRSDSPTHHHYHDRVGA
jgi:hypothetical protein